MRERMTAKVEQMVHEHTSSILRAAFRRERREMMTEYKKTVENTLLRFMNSYITVDAEDTALGGGTFDRSVYARGGSPMRFEGLPEAPAFWPCDRRAEDYDPANFYPEATENSDRIFACRVYYYMMFGAPQKIVFEGDGSPDPISLKLEIPSNKFGALPVKLTLRGEAPQTYAPAAVSGKECLITEDNAKYLAHTGLGPDDDSIYENGTANVSVDSALNVTVSLPGVNRRIYGYHGSDCDDVSMERLSFTAKANADAGKEFERTGSWKCTADLSGTSFKTDTISYEKDWLSAEYHTTVRPVKAELTCERENGALSVYIKLTYDSTTEYLYYDYTEYGEDEQGRREQTGQTVYWDLYGE